MELKIEDIEVTVDHVEDGSLTFNLVALTQDAADCLNTAAILKQSEDADAFLHWAIDSIIDEDYEQLLESDKSDEGKGAASDEMRVAYVAKAICRRVNEILADVKVQ